MVSKSDTLKKDTTLVPPEVLRKYPKCTIVIVDGAAYLRVKCKTRSVASIVWDLNYPKYKLKKGQRVFHIDKDNTNNHYKNLTRYREYMGNK